MRVTHLTDDELQLYLDRWKPGERRAEREAPSIADLEALQHIDHCSRCQGELALYRQLYRELAEPADLRLPRSFARRITWSLPPFAAMRTRARLRTGLSTGFVALLVMAWIFSRVEWIILAARSLAAIGTKLAIVKFWATVLWDHIPPGVVVLPDLSAWWLKLYASVEQAFVIDSRLVQFAILALLAAALVGSADRLLVRIPDRFRLW